MSEKELGFNNEPNQDPEHKQNKDVREQDLKPDQLRQICEQAIAELNQFDLKSQSLKVRSLWDNNSPEYSGLENYNNFMFPIIGFSRNEGRLMELIGIKLYFKIHALYSDFITPHTKGVPDEHRPGSLVSVFKSVDELNEMPEYANNVKEYIENLKVLINEAINNIESQ